MEASVKDRLVEAAKVVDGQPEFTLEVLVDGLRVGYTWKGAPDRLYAVETFVSWQDLEEAPRNPLILAFTSLTKEAGVLG